LVDRFQSPSGPLSRRELEVLRRIAGNLYNREIAESLMLAPNSIKWYTRQIFAKLGVRNRQEAIQRANELGLLDFKTPPVVRPHALSAPLTPFIGRQNELHQVKQILADPASRLLTLTGAGGVGKTRLALQAAQLNQEAYPQGIWLASLGALSDLELVPQAVAAAIELRLERNCPPIVELIEALRDQRALLLLDNCEHLIAACAALASALLQGCPHLQILATSREALGISGETIYLVPPLSLPEPDRTFQPGELMQFEAVALFVQRAKAASSAFGLDEANAGTVVQICRQLDGLPLALELAAAHVRGLDIEEIASELADRLRLLRGGDRTAPARLQTMQASIEWSYTLLPEPEKILLRHVYVFSGSWNLAAARAVCADRLVPEAGVLELLESLVNKSMVLVQRGHGRELRYRLLDTVRQYAAGKASQAGEVAGLRDLHLAYFGRLAGQAARGLEGANPLTWLRRLDDELDNLRYALEWALANNVEAGLKLLIDTDRFWYQRAHVREQYDWINSFINRPEAQAHPHLRAVALEIQSNALLVYMGDPLKARQCAEMSLALAKETGDTHEQAMSLYLLGYIAVSLGDPLGGRRLYEESLASYAQLGDRIGQARVLGQLSYLSSKDEEQARRYAEQGLALCREAGDRVNVSRRLMNLATLACRRSDYAAARTYITEAVAIQRQSELKYDLAESLDVFGRVAFRLGELEAARAAYIESIALNNELGRAGENIWSRADLAYLSLRMGKFAAARQAFVDSLRRLKAAENMGGVTYIIEGLASLAVAEGQGERAARLYAWADAMRQKNGGHRPANEQADVEADMASLRSRLDPPALQAAAAAGRAMTLEQVLAYACEESK